MHDPCVTREVHRLGELHTALGALIRPLTVVYRLGVARQVFAPLKLDTAVLALIASLALMQGSGVAREIYGE